LLNISEVPIIATIPLKLNRNPYLPEDKNYFEQRKTKLMTAKFRAAIYIKYNNLCPLCSESLHNGEHIDLHHILPRKDGGKYTLENIKPLHQVCHQQVTYLHNKFIKISENAS
jgi:RNA-directed DNA polymerase